LTDGHQQSKENGLTSPLPEGVNGETRPTPPTEEPADVEENVTKANVLDIQRYLRWADKFLKRDNGKNKAA
jgi:hypothetical protein